MKMLPSRKTFAVWSFGRRRLVFFLREYLFPSGCALCGSSLVSVGEAWYGLCENCYRELGRESGAKGACTDSPSCQEARYCDLCGKPLVSEQGRCLSCRNSEGRAYDRALVLYPYTGKYQKLLGAYKFGKNLALGHFWAECMGKAIAELCEAERGTPFALVPVPPRPGKIKEQGWDQVEYLAQALEKGWGGSGQESIDVCRCLKRLPSKTQKELGREDRLKNLQNRISLIQKPPQAAIVIDDVVTTGATLDACASVLKAGGTEKVYSICLVYD
jgi:ComF family protein